jgi:hypothetical protein
MNTPGEVLLRHVKNILTHRADANEECDRHKIKTLQVSVKELASNFTSLNR